MCCQIRCATTRDIYQWIEKKNGGEHFFPKKSPNESVSSHRVGPKEAFKIIIFGVLLLSKNFGRQRSKICKRAHFDDRNIPNNWKRTLQYRISVTKCDGETKKFPPNVSKFCRGTRGCEICGGLFWVRLVCIILRACYKYNMRVGHCGT